MRNSYVPVFFSSEKSVFVNLNVCFNGKCIGLRIVLLVIVMTNKNNMYFACISFLSPRAMCSFSSIANLRHQHCYEKAIGSEQIELLKIICGRLLQDAAKRNGCTLTFLTLRGRILSTFHDGLIWYFSLPALLDFTRKWGKWSRIQLKITNWMKLKTFNFLVF